VGSTPHLSGEIFRIANDLDLPTVQFTGAAPAIQATVGGHTPVAFSAVPPAAPQIQQGLLRGLAVTAENRSAALPEVPTMAEAGIQGQEAYTLTGMLAPAGTPPEIVDRLHQEIVNLVALPDVQQRLEELGFAVVANSPAEFAARIKTELEKWAQVIRAAKIKPQEAK
jgi:tripartite-type tricarboxylate transporter receptor subunit TctC